MTRSLSDSVVHSNHGYLKFGSATCSSSGSGLSRSRDDGAVSVAGVDAVRALMGRRLREVRVSGGATLTRVARLTGAAVGAYLAALLLLDDPRPVLAPLTALLIVQVTLVGTITDTVRRILSVVAGVAIAIVFSAFVGFSWWSLALLCAGSILVGQLLRLGPHLLEVPISAMLVLAVGGSQHAALDRVTATVVGAAVGLLVNVLFPPAVQTRSAGAAIEQYAGQLAGLLDRAADGLTGRLGADQAAQWLDEARELSAEAAQVEQALARLEESRRLNPRAVGTASAAPGLRSGLSALEHAAVALRSLYRSLADRARHQPASEPLYSDEIGEVFAALLRDLARAVRDFGALIRVEPDEHSQPDSAELAAALDSAREARAKLTELLLVDPNADPESWQLHGALLAAADRVLRELDVEERARQREAQRQALADSATRAGVTAQRLRSATKAATRSVADAVAELPHPGARKGDGRARQPDNPG